METQYHGVTILSTDQGILLIGDGLVFYNRNWGKIIKSVLITIDINDET